MPIPGQGQCPVICAANLPVIPSTCTSNISGTTIDGIEQQLFYLVNQDRLNAGLAPYQYDCTLAQFAQKKACDLASNRYFCHCTGVDSTGECLDPNSAKCPLASSAPSYDANPQSPTYQTSMCTRNGMCGLSTWDWILQAGASGPYSAWGENIATISGGTLPNKAIAACYVMYGTPSGGVTGWMEDCGHRCNILNGTADCSSGGACDGITDATDDMLYQADDSIVYNVIGIGVCYDRATSSYYFVQEFGTR